MWNVAGINTRKLLIVFAQTESRSPLDYLLTPQTDNLKERHFPESAQPAGALIRECGDWIMNVFNYKDEMIGEEKGMKEESRSQTKEEANSSSSSSMSG